MGFISGRHINEGFSWNGDIDTIMKPIDSIKYYKSHLRASMMSMEPQTGHVKAWVGGFNINIFSMTRLSKEDAK